MKFSCVSSLAANERPGLVADDKLRLPNKIHTFSGFLFLSPKNRAFIFMFVIVNLATLWLNFVTNNRPVMKN